jgi:hypothetical protein
MTALEQLVRPLQTQTKQGDGNYLLHFTETPSSEAPTSVLNWTARTSSKSQTIQNPYAYRIKFKKPKHQQEIDRDVEEVKIKNPDDESQYLKVNRVKAAYFKQVDDPKAPTQKVQYLSKPSGNNNYSDAASYYYVDQDPASSTYGQEIYGVNPNPTSADASSTGTDTGQVSGDWVQEMYGTGL